MSMQTSHTDWNNESPFLYATTFWNVLGGPLTVYETILVVSSILESLLDVTNFTVKMDTMSFVEIRYGDGNFALLSFHLKVCKTRSRFLPAKGVWRKCHEIQVLFRFFISILFHVHLAMTLWYPQSPSSMLCRCCDLCRLRNRKINIVWEEGECFQGNQNPITLWVLLKNQSTCRLQKRDSMLLKQIAQLPEVNFGSLRKLLFL